MSLMVVRGDARCLPLPDASCDLIVTSPPYFGLRSYTDGGTHYSGQIGSEATPAEWLANLLDCTREWMRVLKPSGSIWVNLGDKYAAGHGGSSTEGNGVNLTVQRDRPAAEHWTGAGSHPSNSRAVIVPGTRPKSLLGLPWRYALGCIDQLGLILRAEVIWSKPNGLPESVTDRVRRSHEQWFHLVKQPRYYSAVDEVREAQSTIGERHGGNTSGYARATPDMARSFSERTLNPLGKLPGSVWDIPSQPLIVPASLGVDHFAAFPMELPRRIIQGWSPPGICTACGEGRRPVAVADKPAIKPWTMGQRAGWSWHGDAPDPKRTLGGSAADWNRAISGYACACDRPHRPEHETCAESREGCLTCDPPATRPAVVLDPFGGTGTTALIASVLGRTGISIDRSADYCRLARWRTTDPGQRAQAMQVPKPPPVMDGQGELELSGM